MLTDIKTMYQSLESINRIIILSFIKLDKIRLTRRADVYFAKMLFENVTANNTGKVLLQILNKNSDLNL